MVTIYDYFRSIQLYHNPNGSFPASSPSPLPHFSTEKPIWLILIGGFRYTYPSEESDFVSWDIIIIFPIYGQSTNSMVPDHQSAIPLPKNRRASKILHQGLTCSAEKFSITKLRPRPPRRSSMEHWLWRKRSKRSPAPEGLRGPGVQGWSRWRLEIPWGEKYLHFSLGWDHRWSLLLKKNLPQLIKIGVDWHFRFFWVAYNCVLKLW